MKSFSHTAILLFCFLLISAATPAFAGGGDSLGVEEVVQQVLAQHPALVQAADMIDVAEARVRIAESAWNPNVNVEAAYVRLAPIATIQLGPEEFRLFPANNYDAHLAAWQQLYDFGKTAASTALTRSRSDAARAGVESGRAMLAYQSIHTFYTILYLREAVDVQVEQIRTLREHIDVARKRVSSGSGTDFDVLTTQVRLAAAQNQEIDLRNAEHKAEISLARLLGREQSDTLQLTGTFDQSAVPLRVDTLLAQAVHQRPELRAARIEEESARMQVQISSVSERPSLNLGVMYGFKNGYVPGIDALHGNLAASLRLEVPVYEGGRGSYREEESRAQLHAAQAHVRDVEQQVAQDVRQAVSDLQSALDKLSGSDLQLTQAREALTIARKRYDIGAISNLDLLDTETSLQKAHLLRLQALYELTANRYALARAVGAEPWR